MYKRINTQPFAHLVNTTNMNDIQDKKKHNIISLV